MKLIGIMAARNEDWVLGLAARAALMWLDGLVILDHASTDSTPEICVELAEEHPWRVRVIHDSDPVWREMAQRQRMLEAARKLGATHIVYIDADEILTGDLVSLIRGYFTALPANCILEIPWLAMRGGIDKVHTSGPWADQQNVSLGFADKPELHWTSETRGGYDFHHRKPMGKVLVPWNPICPNPWVPQRRLSGLMHLQFVSDRRLRAKQALYKMTEVLRWPGREPVAAVNQRYNLAVYGRRLPGQGWQEQLDETVGNARSDEWWEPYEPLMKRFHPCAFPWQETECVRLLNEHGSKKFLGLDLFGLEERGTT